MARFKAGTSAAWGDLLRRSRGANVPNVPVGNVKIRNVMPGRNLRGVTPGRMRHGIFLQVEGIEGTAAALAKWQATVARHYALRKHEIEKIIKDAIDSILETGRSKSTKFTPVSDITRDIRVKKGKSGSDKPFVGGTGDLKKSVRVRASRNPFVGGRAKMAEVEIVGGAAARRKAAAVILGSARVIDESVSKAIYALTVKEGEKNSGVYVPPGAVMVTPPRDFIAAGVQDSLDEVEEKFKEIIAGANAETVLKIPVIKAPRTVAGTMVTR